jgi:hypothetical protein
MAAEPTKEPEWASVPAVDPISGQSNIVEPTESKKDSGFNFQERPPRQDFNWLFNLIWEWIKYFKSSQRHTVWDPTWAWNGTGIGLPDIKNQRYVIDGKILLIFVNLYWTSAESGGSGNTQLSTTLPAVAEDFGGSSYYGIQKIWASESALDGWIRLKDNSNELIIQFDAAVTAIGSDESLGFALWIPIKD